MADSVQSNNVTMDVSDKRALVATLDMARQQRFYSDSVIDGVAAESLSGEPSVDLKMDTELQRAGNNAGSDLGADKGTLQDLDMPTDGSLVPNGQTVITGQYVAGDQTEAAFNSQQCDGSGAGAGGKRKSGKKQKTFRRFKHKHAKANAPKWSGGRNGSCVLVEVYEKYHLWLSKDKKGWQNRESFSKKQGTRAYYKGWHSNVAGQVDSAKDSQTQPMLGQDTDTGVQQGTAIVDNNNFQTSGAYKGWTDGETNEGHGILQSLGSAPGRSHEKCIRPQRTQVWSEPNTEAALLVQKMADPTQQHKMKVLEQRARRYRAEVRRHAVTNQKPAIVARQANKDKCQLLEEENQTAVTEKGRKRATESGSDTSNALAEKRQKVDIMEKRNTRGCTSDEKSLSANGSISENRSISVQSDCSSDDISSSVQSWGSDASSNGDHLMCGSIEHCCYHQAMMARASSGKSSKNSSEESTDSAPPTKDRAAQSSFYASSAQHTRMVLKKRAAGRNRNRQHRAHRPSLHQRLSRANGSSDSDAAAAKCHCAGNSPPPHIHEQAGSADTPRTANGVHVDEQKEQSNSNVAAGQHPQLMAAAAAVVMAQGSQQIEHQHKHDVECEKIANVKGGEPCDKVLLYQIAEERQNIAEERRLLAEERVKVQLEREKLQMEIDKLHDEVNRMQRKRVAAERATRTTVVSASPYPGLPTGGYRSDVKWSPVNEDESKSNMASSGEADSAASGDSSSDSYNSSNATLSTGNTSSN